MPLPRTWVPLLLLAAMLPLMNGCGLIWRRVPRPAAPPESGPPLAAAEVQRLTEALEVRRSAKLLTLQATCRAVAEVPGEGRRVFNAVLIAQPPTSLRFRATREPVGELFQILARGEELAFYFPRERTLFIGPESELSPTAGLLYRLRPLRLLQAITAYDEMLRVATNGRWQELLNNEALLIAPVDYPNVVEASFVVERTTLDLRRVYLHGPGPDRPVLAAAVYDRWEARDGIYLPGEMTIDMPQEKSRVLLDNISFRVNPRLRPESFDPPKAADTYPLRALVFEEEKTDREAPAP